MPSSSLQLHRINPSDPSANCHKQYQHNTPLTHKVFPVSSTILPDDITSFHTHTVAPNQCCSAVVQRIKAPVSTLWSIVSRFDNPLAYKHFLKSCKVVYGDGSVGTLRECHVVSGLPAAYSLERLEILDEERHVFSFIVVGGDHRLQNYRSVTTLHIDNGEDTILVESYVVDVPAGNTKEETCVFVDTIVKCNLQSLAQLAENMAKKDKKSSQ